MPALITSGSGDSAASETSVKMKGVKVESTKSKSKKSKKERKIKSDDSVKGKGSGKKSKKDKKKDKKRKNREQSDDDSDGSGGNASDGSTDKNSDCQPTVNKKARLSKEQQDSPDASAVNELSESEDTSVAAFLATNKVKITGLNAGEGVEAAVTRNFDMFPGKIQRILVSQGFTAPTPIQSLAWPLAIQKRDIVAVAKTGSGKTLGFGLPAMLHLRPLREQCKRGDAPIVLILAPTRELACQIQTELHKVTAPCGIRVKSVYGGVPRGEQIRDIREGVDIVVATPGRLIDMAEFGQISLDKISFVTLDEADRMLDMGFEPDIRKIMAKITPGYQMLLFTATWPKKVSALAREFLKNPVSIKIGDNDGGLVANKNITQIVRVVPLATKNDEFFKLLIEINSDDNGFAKSNHAKTLVFCSTKRYCAQLARDMSKEGYSSQALHGDMEQQERDRGLLRFRQNKCKFLVATDVAARGLDVTDVEYVINYDCPNAMEDYVHRIGRTGRAGRTGTAYTFFTPEKDITHAAELTKLLTTAAAEVPDALRAMAKTKRGQGGGSKQPWRGGRGRGGRSGRGGGKRNYYSRNR
eukprot:m.220911 g.220911  ORF g.220911 m.220911 type:complete len:584 (+) comp19174_c0_seq2:431-2182(+)